ncbi:hypothetical protein GCM10010123_45720 [Pilimelia anulata]|uniref:DUF3307 domain-containing protein n=1 Tax=Pilimelia anulata TaxID=53371 RepID=A0A8J3BHN4_9ACTN|nr:DUF3307 domain-containing protein [Pilimelia anulata]GGK10587.1 hypothetical protein GCM10010123_45720 [Pilimelia anulata]
MLNDPTTAAATFAAAYIALHVSHSVADYWVQTDHQANAKGQPGWPGRRACAAHVTTYLATQAVALAAVVAVLHLPVTPVQATAALALSGVTHYVVDRRAPLLWLARKLGMREFLDLGVARPGTDDRPCLGTGPGALDQSWHHFWVGAAALLIAA